MLKILFMGTPDFAKESMQKIYERNYNIIGVVTNPDKPKGRGMQMVASPVKEYAIQKKIKIYQPEQVKKNEEFINEIKQLNPDIICVVAYGKILPKEILDIPKYGCINLHASLLPKYRGAAPIQWAILNGDKETGVTTMYMNEKMDEGDIILQKKVDIKDNETTGELWNRLSLIGAELLIDTFEVIERKQEKRTKQSSEFSIAPMITKEMSKINWENQNAQEIKNLVRGLNPIMGAYTFLNDKKIKFWKVEVLEIREFIDKFTDFAEYEYKFDEITAGTILFVSEKKGLYIKSNDKIISVLEIQGENSKKMNVFDYLRGNKVFVADMFV